MAIPIQLARYEIAIKPIDTIIMPIENKGNTLRGGFGNVFKQMTCIQPRDSNDCKKCYSIHTCPYSAIFEPASPPGSEYLSKNADIPRPFVIKPPLTRKTEYTKDDMLRFSLVLANKAIENLPYFMVAFQELGNVGIGQNRGKYTLADFANAQDKTAPVAAGEAIIAIPPVSAPVSRIKLNFITETTIKSGGAILEKPEFGAVVKRLRDRVASLGAFYGERWEEDFKAMGELAEGVRLVEDNTYWANKSRYSKRKEVKHDMSGFVGEAVYEGDITPFVELLRIGEHIHVGKGAVFGNGWYEIKEER